MFKSSSTTLLRQRGLLEGWLYRFSIANSIRTSGPLLAESPLATLRRKTGYALNLCKKALANNENDVSKAELWLKEEARKNGWQKASQMQTRRAAEGLVGVFVHPNHRSGVLLEVNCETDFVARNEKFRSLVNELTLQLATATIVKKTDNEHLNALNNVIEPLRKYPITGEQLAPFNDQVAEAVTQLGEKIQVRRATLVENRRAEAAEASVRLLSYAHAVGDQANHVGGSQVAIGKYATLLAYREVPPTVAAAVGGSEATAASEKPSTSSSTVASEAPAQTEQQPETDPDAFEVVEQSNSLMADATTREQVAKLICQHIIGCSPKTLVSDKKQPKDNALLDQKFLANEAVTIGQLCTERGLQLVDFERYECGAELPENNDPQQK